jgi:hypothetical protein
MTQEEIVKALRNSCRDCNPTPCCEYEVLGSEAADLIETLTARAERAEAGNKKLRQEIDITDAANTALEGALKQAEAERDAAIADMRPKYNCDICKYTREGVEDCVTYDGDCAVCKSKKCVCRNCRNENKWEWRGARKEGT